MKFESQMIAPCGMNCMTCIAYLRTKKKCRGCRDDSEQKNKACAQCRIKNCTLLDKTDSKFCYDCSAFPCLRLKQIDKRYSTKYRTSFLENLRMIKESGMDNFLLYETERRTCPNCKSTVSVHRSYCLACQEPLK